MAMSPEQMKRLAELRTQVALQKTATTVTLPPMFNMKDAVGIYLKEVGAEVLKLVAAVAWTEEADPELEVKPDGSVTVSSYQFASEQTDFFTIDIDWSSSSLVGSYTQNSTKTPRVSKSWKIARIEGLPAPRMAKLIYDIYT